MFLSLYKGLTQSCLFEPKLFCATHKPKNRFFLRLTGYFVKNATSISEPTDHDRRLDIIPEADDEEFGSVTNVKSKEERIPEVFRKLFHMESVHDVRKFNI